MLSPLARFWTCLALAGTAYGQTPPPPREAKSDLAALPQTAPITRTPAAPTIVPSPKEKGGTPADVGFTPSWETQKQARTYLLGIPAPRGQIVDRNGNPLAHTRVAYNLAISFPTPLNFTDRDVVAFAQQQAQRAQTLLGRPINIAAESVARHYKNRGVLPYVIAQDLRPGELEVF